MAEKTHRVVLRPGEKIDIVLAERLVNGYQDEVGWVDVTWQDRDAPPGEIATKGRELQITTRPERGRVGPVVVTQR